MANPPSLPIRRAHLLLPILLMTAACGQEDRMQDPTAGPARSAARLALLAPPSPGGYQVRAAPSPPESGHGPPVAWSCTGGCPADSSVVDFELFTNPSVYHQLTTQYDALGVIFDSTVVAVVPGYYYQNYPPRSGAAVATADFTLPGGGSGFLYFSFPAAEAVRVRIYVTSLSPVTLRCFDAGGAELGATPFAGGNTVETQGGVPNQPVEVSASGIRSCRLEGADNQYGIDDLTVVWREDPTPMQSVLVSCTPTPVVRGENVRCETTLTTSMPYTVVRRTTTSEMFTVEELVAETKATGEVDVWTGDAVATGAIAVEVIVDSAGVLVALIGQDSIHVLPRAWQGWTLVDGAHFIQLVPRFNMRPYPSVGTALGLFQVLWPDSADLAIARPSTGPNKGIGYLQTPVAATGYNIATHPALYPPNSSTLPPSRRWYEDQNGIGSGTCLSPQIAVLAGNVERHEGVTQSANSHFGVANRQFALLQPQLLVESMVSADSNDQLKQSFQQFLMAFAEQGAYASAQAQFDNDDAPSVFAIGCTLDFKLSDP